MAYVHESEVIVKTALPDPVPESTRTRSESPAGDDMAVEKSPSPELEEVVSPRKRLSPASAVGFDKSVPDGLKALPKAVKTAHPLSREVEPEDSDDSDTGVPPPPTRSAAPATYVCGYALGRAGTICETRLSSQEERVTHQRFVHGVRASSSHKDKFLQEAKIKMQKQMEQERINKKMGQKGKKKLDSGVSGMSLHARKAATGKALASASGHRRS